MISFGLVTIPVELRSATKSLAPAFHLVHEECGTRVRQQLYCPTDKRVVERSELVRGFDVGKEKYVVFTPEELEHLEGEASRTIEISEFVPLQSVDPIYYETTYYLAPGKGGDKAYGLLASTMASRSRPTSCGARKTWSRSARTTRGSSCTRCSSRTRCGSARRSRRRRAAAARRRCGSRAA
jgi:DNA end-binding protein Ku